MSSMSMSFSLQEMMVAFVFYGIHIIPVSVEVWVMFKVDDHAGVVNDAFQGNLNTGQIVNWSPKLVLVSKASDKSLHAVLALFLRCVLKCI